MNTQRRPLRMIAPGIYTTFDGRYRVENIRVATGDPSQQDTWELYLQHESGVTSTMLDERATFVSGNHRVLKDATQALAGIYGENLVSGCVKECACTPEPVEQLRPGQLVDLAGDPFADPHQDQPRYEWQFMEVVEVERESPDCIRVAFEDDSIGFPPTHMLRVLNEPAVDEQGGARRADDRP